MKRDLPMPAPPTTLMIRPFPCCAAVSQAPKNPDEAARLEDALVRRSFALSESLLRQATTPDAAAYDPGVVRRHMAGTLEISRTLLTLKGD